MIKSLEEDKFHNCKVILNLSKIKKENRNNYLNLLRISMMYKIETYAIEYVTFYDKGEKNLHDELIAFQLGQLTIDCEKYNPENNKHKIVKQGGDYTFLTTKDFENILKKTSGVLADKKIDPVKWQKNIRSDWDDR